MILRWFETPKAFWYEINIEPYTPQIVIVGAEGTGDGAIKNSVKEKFAIIKQLVPGTNYTFSITAENHEVFNTSSEEAVLWKYTRECTFFFICCNLTFEK